MDPYGPIGRVPRRRARAPGRPRLGRLLLVASGLAAFLLATAGVDFYTDWLWFSAVGYLDVYRTVLGLQAALLAIGATLFGAIFAANTLLARHLGRRVEQSGMPDDEGIWSYIARIGARVNDQSAYRRLINQGLFVFGTLLSIAMGLVLAGQWPVVQRYLNATPFGVADPVFGQDVGFYVFDLPLFRMVHAWLLGTLIFVAGGALTIYAVVVVYELGSSLERAVFGMPRSIKAHLAALGAVLMLLIAANHVLDVFEVVYSSRGAAYGGGYTDIRAQVPALWVMTGAAVLAAGLFLLTIVSRGVRPALVGLGLWLFSSIAIGLFYPNTIESLEVKPNQLDKERPYITYSIESTLRAYGLDRVQEQFYPADDAVTAEDIRANPQTIGNIRLWDHRPLLDTLNQIQSIRAYYSFEDVDVDRYQLRGGYQQVMLAARELNRDVLQQTAPSWVNQRLKFTHGYGLAMSLVSAVAEEGRPVLMVQDVPPRGEIQIDRPEIYYGQRGSTPYVVVKTAEREFDFPSGDSNAESSYVGGGGVNVGSPLSRLVYALKFRDGNLLLSGSLRQESELLYRRNIVERIQRLAPFLLLDSDPYLVVADGQLFWMLDAYTHSDSYPYSAPRLCAENRALHCNSATLLRLNYLRNSVKITVNAYDGSTRFYLADPTDPIVQTYARAFPGLLAPIDQMPATLRQHVRYPEDLFSIQSDVYQTYHMTDPNVFYNKEDPWALATEKFDQGQQQVQPYYVIMRLPGEQREEFLLMLPFTPRGKDNMISWLAARSDGPQYGKLLVYKYPKERLVYGPSQFESRIDQDPAISAQLSLWSQRGSKVLRGNTLVIPVGRSTLYVEPLYLQSDANKGAIPELKQVVIATGNRLVMEPSLEAAIARLFGVQSAPASLVGGAAPGPPTAGTALPPAASALARSANDHLARAQQALRDGDWARYGEEQRLLQDDLRKLVELIGP